MIVPKPSKVLKLQKLTILAEAMDQLLDAAAKLAQLFCPAKVIDYTTNYLFKPL